MRVLGDERWLWTKDQPEASTSSSSFGDIAGRLVYSKFFDIFTALVIVASLVILVFEVNADARCYPEYAQSFQDCPVSSLQIQWLEHANTALLLIFSIECLARACAEQSRFFCNGWNLIDVATVLVGFLGKMWTSTLNVNFLRAFRLLCICRSSRMVTSVPELRVLLVALKASMRALVVAAVFLLFILFLWAIVAVETLHPLLSSSHASDDALAFEDVWKAAVTILLQMGGWIQEDFGDVVLDAPWTAAIFFGILVSMSFGVMITLVLIVECYTRACEQDQQQKWEDENAQSDAHLHQLAAACSNLDTMRRGSLQMAELIGAYQGDVAGFRSSLATMGIESREQLETICVVLAAPTGQVGISEFLRHLRGLQKSVARDAWMAYTVLELKRLVKAELTAPRGAFPRGAPRLAQASPTLRLAPLLPEETSPLPQQEVVRRRWARHCIQSFENLQKGMDPLLLQAEHLLQEVLEETAFEPPFQDCRIEIEIDSDAATPDMPSRYDWLLDQRSSVLCDSFNRSLEQLSSLEGNLRCIQQRLSKLRSGFDGRTESL